MANDWFRNKLWSPAIEQDFLQQLGQTAYNDRITALKVQGDTWLGNPDQATQLAGIRLLENLIADYADEVYEVATVQEILGMHFRRKADFKSAERYLTLVLQFYTTHKRTGVIRRADFTIAEMIILQMIPDRLEEALQLLINFPLTGGSISEDYEQHNYHELLAYGYYLSDKRTEAADHATKALAVAQTIELDFMIAKPDSLEGYYEQLPALERIAAKG